MDPQRPSEEEHHQSWNVSTVFSNKISATSRAGLLDSGDFTKTQGNIVSLEREYPMANGNPKPGAIQEGNKWKAMMVKETRPVENTSDINTIPSSGQQTNKKPFNNLPLLEHLTSGPQTIMKFISDIPPSGQEANLLNAMAQVSLDHGNGTRVSEMSSERIPPSIKLVVSGPPELDNASKILKNFLLKNSPEFARVNSYREKGWFENKEKGDAHFVAQRERADHADLKDERKFFDMMIQIANEMQVATKALTPRGVTDFKVLDLCMAPGGYSAAVLNLAPGAEVYGITLPDKDLNGKPLGGHGVILNHPRLKIVKKADITMFATEFSDAAIPPGHPEHNKFSMIRPYGQYKFHLVLCDGIKLRTHIREGWREKNEALRLSVSQLIFALQRIVQGGNIVMLLHKVDMWQSTSILYTFSKFARVNVFKPTRKHQTRSSFYMVAEDVQPDSDDAKAALKEWRRIWWETTCGGPQGNGQHIEEPSEESVLGVIKHFGKTLIELGHDSWKIQADALSKTDFAGDGSGTKMAHQQKDRKGNRHWRVEAKSGEAYTNEPNAENSKT